MDDHIVKHKNNIALTIVALIMASATPTAPIPGGRASAPETRGGGPTLSCGSSPCLRPEVELDNK
jgi:hypothetical protein